MPAERVRSTSHVVSEECLPRPWGRFGDAQADADGAGEDVTDSENARGFGSHAASYAEPDRAAVAASPAGMTDFIAPRPSRWRTFWERPVTGLFWPVGMLLIVLSNLLPLSGPTHLLVIAVAYLLVFSIVIRPWGSNPVQQLGRRFVGRWDLLLPPVFIAAVASWFVPLHSPLAITAQALIGVYALVELVWRLLDLAVRRPER